ncbi:rare lipoprotein A [Calothrix sp. NIES-4071]|nr:rare lipoprotein A [Calothrix sp. NIES-4071]BAZ58425.1 rare lipoprotein A [Calothrix sp. NIES-4105]
MNNTKLWSVVALSTTVLGLPSVASAATKKTSPQLPPSGDTTNGESEATQKTAPATPTAVTQIHAHTLAGKQAATLYVRSIPVLTFVGQETNPVERANVIAAKINQLVASKVDANQITASWTKNGQSIKVNGEELVKIDASTILPDTTNDLAQDTLQATNRLRRLIGGAQPLNQPTIARQENTQPQQTAKQPQVANQQPTPQKPQQNTNAKVKATATGTASYYSYGNSTRTATGERFNPQDLTAAHRTLPFGTRVRVTNNWNGRSVIVRINDRGPFIRGRIIDVSLGAARQLGMISTGIASVKVEVLDNL